MRIMYMRKAFWFVWMIVSCLAVGLFTMAQAQNTTDTAAARIAVEKMVEAMKNADADLFVQVVEVDPAEKVTAELSEVAKKLKPGLLAIQGHHQLSGGIQKVNITDEKVVDANTIQMKMQFVFKNGQSEPPELTTVVRKTDGWKVRMLP